MWCNNVSSIHFGLFNMTDEKNILYKKDYVTAAKTDIRKTFAKYRKEQKQNQKISTIEKTQPINIIQYKKFK
jgi:hypothetical protein